MPDQPAEGGGGYVVDELCVCTHPWVHHKRQRNGALGCTHFGCGCRDVVEPVRLPLRAMQTSINGQPAPWTAEIWELWYTYVDRADPKAYDVLGRPTSANYFTPRPYRNIWDRGDRKEGFTYTVGRKVYQVVIAGGMPWTTAEPGPGAPGGGNG